MKLWIVLALVSVHACVAKVINFNIKSWIIQMDMETFLIFRVG